MAGLVVLGLLIGLNYWAFVRPNSVEQRFVRLVLNEEFVEAAGMLSNPCSVSINGDSYRLTALDGSSVEIPIGKAELNVFDEPKRSPRNGIVDCLLCRKHFSICAIWKEKDGSHFVPIFCTTRGSAVVLDHVGITE